MMITVLRCPVCREEDYICGKCGNCGYILPDILREEAKFMEFMATPKVARQIRRMLKKVRKK